MQKLVGFTGLKISLDLAQSLLDHSTKFCEEYDPDQPRNAGKKVDPKYKPYLPLAKWVRVAADIALKQGRLFNIGGELKKSTTRISILNGELNELNERYKGWDTELNSTQESIKETDVFIDAVSNHI